MSVKQISIFLENKPGKMCEMTEVLAERGINMRGNREIFIQWVLINGRR